MGESYAGIYIPLLAIKIQENQRDNRFNLKVCTSFSFFSTFVQQYNPAEEYPERRNLFL